MEGERARAAGTGTQLRGRAGGACRCSWNSQAGYEAANRMRRRGGACQGFDIMRGSCSALPTDGCGALPWAGSGRTWWAPPWGAAHPCYPCPLVFVGFLLFSVLFQENQLLPCMLNHPAKQVVLLQGASPLIFPAGPKSQLGSPCSRRGVRSCACAFPTGAVGKLPVSHLRSPRGDALARDHPCSCGARTEIIRRRTPLGNKVQGGNPTDGTDLPCLVLWGCSQAWFCLQGPLWKPGVWVQGSRNVFSQSLCSGEFSLLPPGARWWCLPRIQHLHN